MHAKSSYLTVLPILLFGLLLCVGCGKKSPARLEPKAETKIEPKTEPETLLKSAVSNSSDAQDPANETSLNYQALVVGISDYQSASTRSEISAAGSWANLPSARRDAQAIGALLQSRYDFSVQGVYDEAATRDNLLRQIEGLLSRASSEDAVLLYFAGHGRFDAERSEGCWIPAQAPKLADSKDAYLWNSDLTRLVNTSQARHVLVIADSCYSGSFFRNLAEGALSEESEEPLANDWYRRTIHTPSRYLITSGDNEPVLDGGNEHSVFATSVMNALKNPPPSGIFSAFQLARRARAQVFHGTGQMIQMGPIQGQSRLVGGEFVFKSADAEWPENFQIASSSEQDLARIDGEGSTKKPALPVAVIRGDSAVPSSGPLALSGETSNQVDQAIMAHFTGVPRSRSERTSILIRDIERNMKANADAVTDTATGTVSTAAYPNVITCLGPTVVGLPASKGETSPENDLALLTRFSMESALSQEAGITVVDREALDDILQELSLSASSISDAQAKTLVGKLLPASHLITGKLLPLEPGKWRLQLRLVRTETSEIKGMYSQIVSGREEIEAATQAWAQQISQRILSHANIPKPPEK